MRNRDAAWKTAFRTWMVRISIGPPARRRLGQPRRKAGGRPNTCEWPPFATDHSPFAQPRWVFACARPNLRANAHVHDPGRRLEGVAVQEDAENDRVVAWRETLRQVDGELAVFRPLHLVDFKNFARRIEQQIARDDEQWIDPARGRPEQWLLYVSVASASLQCHFGVGSYDNRPRLVLNGVDPRTGRMGETVEGAGAQRVGHLPHGLQHDRVGGPTLEPVRAVGDQKVAILLGIDPERPPARVRLLRGYQSPQRRRAIALPLELRDQLLQPCDQCAIPHQIEPRNPS